MAKDLFDEDEVVIGNTYGWYNIQNQRFCSKFMGIEKNEKGWYLLMEHKSKKFPQELLRIKEIPGRFPSPLRNLHIFKTESDLKKYLKHVKG